MNGLYVLMMTVNILRGAQERKKMMDMRYKRMLVLLLLFARLMLVQEVLLLLKLMFCLQ